MHTSTDIKAEIEQRSSFQKQVQADKREYMPMLEKLAGEVQSFVPQSVDDVVALALRVDTALMPLCDETLVLKGLDFWPQARLDIIREIAARIGEIRQLQRVLDVKGTGWVAKAGIMEEVSSVLSQYTKLTSQVEWLEKQAARDRALLQQLQLPPDSLSREVATAKLSSLGAVKYVMQMGLTASSRLVEAREQGAVPAATLAHHQKTVVNVLEHGMRLGFRCHQFAGGLDKESVGLFHQVRQCLELHQEPA